MKNAGDTRLRQNQHTAHVCRMCAAPLRPLPIISVSQTHTHSRTDARLTLFAFAYTQSQIRGLNCYHMVTIARAPNRSKTRSTAEKWEAGSARRRERRRTGLGPPPVHQVHEHLRVLLELPHLHRVQQDAVEVSQKVFHLEGIKREEARMKRR